MKDLNIIPCGTEVTIKIQGGKNFSAIIEEVSIKYNHVSYKACWFWQGSYKEEWIHLDQILSYNQNKKIKVGFKNM